MWETKSVPWVPPAPTNIITGIIIMEYYLRRIIYIAYKISVVSNQKLKTGDWLEEDTDRRMMYEWYSSLIDGKIDQSITSETTN